MPKALMTIMNGRFSIHHASRRCVLPNRVRPFTVEESATLLYTPQTRIEYSRKQFLQITIAPPRGRLDSRVIKNSTSARFRCACPGWPLLERTGAARDTPPSSLLD